MSTKGTGTESATADSSVAAVVMLTRAASGLATDGSVSANAVVRMSSFEGLTCWVTNRRILVQKLLAL